MWLEKVLVICVKLTLVVVVFDLAESSFVRDLRHQGEHILHAQRVVSARDGIVHKRFLLRQVVRLEGL